MKKQIRVYLRALELDDHLIIHKWRNDPDVALFFVALEGSFQYVHKKNIRSSICVFILEHLRLMTIS